MIYKVLSKVEQICAKYQGKGWGASTITQEINSVSKFLNKPKLAIDIGGNVGEYADQLRQKFANLEIHLFEPSLTNYHKLAGRFNMHENVIINRMAVSDDSGSSELFSNEAGSGLASLTKRRLDHFGLDFNISETVETIKFEDYWKSNLAMREIDLIKIDVEGQELKVLNGLGESISKTKLIQFEFGGCNIDSKTYFQDFWYFFKEHSFKIYRITPIGLEHIRQYNEYDEYFMTTNFLCTNNQS